MVGVYNYTEGDYHDIPGATLGSPALIDDGDSAGYHRCRPTGSVPPNQRSTSRRAIDTPDGGTTSPEVIAPASSSRVNQRASLTSLPSTVMVVEVARAVQPSINDAGNGHGWLPR